MTTDTHTQTDLAGELALVEQQARALGNPLPAVDAIVDDLNRLYDRGADLPTLQAIQANAGALLDAVQQSGQTLHAALDLAGRIKQQRDLTRQALDDLKRAIDTVDLDVPEIEALFETVEEMVTEQTWEYIWEVQIDGVVSNTPLSWDEASRLVGILDGDHNLTDGDPLWDALREWIGEVNRV